MVNLFGEEEKPEKAAPKKTPLPPPKLAPKRTHRKRGYDYGSEPRAVSAKIKEGNVVTLWHCCASKPS
jgi:hypothetical protein